MWRSAIDMKKLTQKELLDEGFWDLHKSPILKGLKVAGAIGKGIVKAVDPKLAANVKSSVEGIKNFATDVKASMTSIEDTLKDKYEKNGFRNVIVKKMGDNYIVTAMDENGRFTRDRMDRYGNLMYNTKSGKNMISPSKKNGQPKSKIPKAKA